MTKGVRCWNLSAIILMLLSLFSLSACSSVASSIKETETIKIKLDTLNVKVPELSEYLELDKLNDSIFSIIKWDPEIKDTLIKVVFNSKTRKMSLKVKQPDIKVIKADTTKIYRRSETVTKKESFIDKFFNYLIVIGVMAIIIIGLLKYKYRGNNDK